MFDLLTEKLITTQHEGPPLQMTLPEVLSALSHGQELRFPRVQAHQKHAWFAFLVQSAALALYNAEEEALTPTSTGAWGELLLALSEGDVGAWHLIIEDPERPAFMQPPTRKFNEFSHSKPIKTPLTIDLLVLAKNHDLKMSRHAYPNIEDWLYALITMQTMQGYSGKGNYGIMRMHGGYASRPYVAIVKSLGWSTRFQRDVGLILNRKYQSEYDNELPKLMWLINWEGKSNEKLLTHEIDHDAIEICRLFRLVYGEDQSIFGVKKISEDKRISFEHNFSINDPWTPIVSKKDKHNLLNISGNGFRYDVIVNQILFIDDHLKSLAQSSDGLESNEYVYLYLEVLARGDKGTEGFHQRVLMIPANDKIMSENSSLMKYQSKLVEVFIKNIKTAEYSILKPALLTLLQSGNPKKDKRPNRWVNLLDIRIDMVFFNEFFKVSDYKGLDLIEPEKKWRSTLRNLVQEVFNEAVAEAPSSGVRRYRAIAEAERVLYGALHNNKFPEINSTEQETVNP